MEKMDFNCFAGNWPFFRLRNNTVEKIAACHRKCGISGGFLSSLEAIFYQDPYEAELELSRHLEGTPYMHAMVLNPTLPGWQDDLKRAYEKLHIRAVRFVPGFQNYQLTDPCVEAVMDALRQYRLPLVVTMRMRDERTMWMLQPKEIPVEELRAFLEENADIPTLITHIRPGETEKLSDLFSARENLFVDNSGFKDGLFALDRLWNNTATGGHIVYGSGAPLMEMMATTLQVETGELDDDTKAQIFSGEKWMKYLV